MQNKISPAPEKTALSNAEGGPGGGHDQPPLHPDPAHQGDRQHRAGHPKKTNQRYDFIMVGKNSSKSVVLFPVEYFFIIKLKRPSISSFGVKDFSGTRGQVLNLRIVFDEVVIN